MTDNSGSRREKWEDHPSEVAESWREMCDCPTKALTNIEAVDCCSAQVPAFDDNYNNNESVTVTTDSYDLSNHRSTRALTNFVNSDSTEDSRFNIYNTSGSEDDGTDDDDVLNRDPIFRALCNPTFEFDQGFTSIPECTCDCFDLENIVNQRRGPDAKKTKQCPRCPSLSFLSNEFSPPSANYTALPFGIGRFRSSKSYKYNPTFDRMILPALCEHFESLKITNPCIDLSHEVSPLSDRIRNMKICDNSIFCGPPPGFEPMDWSPAQAAITPGSSVPVTESLLSGPLLFPPGLPVPGNVAAPTATVGVPPAPPLPSFLKANNVSKPDIPPAPPLPPFLKQKNTDGAPKMIPDRANQTTSLPFAVTEMKQVDSRSTNTMLQSGETSGSVQTAFPAPALPRSSRPGFLLAGTDFIVDPQRSHSDATCSTPTAAS